MPMGFPFADSACPVTHVLDGQTLVERATGHFGQTPVLWGRYFTDINTTGSVEYRHANEDALLHQYGIRVLPIARQTADVDGPVSLGQADAQRNVEDVLVTFGVEYLASQGGKCVLVLDVEGQPSLSREYWEGWAQTVILQSIYQSTGQVVLLPMLYAPEGDTATWEALVTAWELGTPCVGVWVACWRWRGCAPLPEWDPTLATAVPLPCPVLGWQYSDACGGDEGFDCNTTNPAYPLETLGILPPAPET